MGKIIKRIQDRQEKALKNRLRTEFYTGKQTIYWGKECVLFLLVYGFIGLFLYAIQK